MRPLTALFAVSSVKLLATVLSRKFAKESIMKSPPLPAKRRARPLVKESTNNIHKRGTVAFPLVFLTKIIFAAIR